MARCCGGATCACKVESGRHVEITGTGTAQDPFVISSQTNLTVQDTSQFQLVLNGNGTLGAPWTLQVVYADGAGLTGLPDVYAESPTNGQVLGYDDSINQWVPQAPTTAAAGVNNVGNGIDGDGSVGDPLVAVGNAARYISVTASGIGLSDSGINQLVRRFADVAARDVASPPPIEGTISILDSDPSRLDYYDGTDWLVITGGVSLDIEGELLATSGNYSGGSVTTWVRQLETSTDGTGAFVAISADDLVDYSGVISCKVIPHGSGTPWTAMLLPGSGVVAAVARRLSDGAPLTGATITATVEATLY